MNSVGRSSFLRQQRPGKDSKSGRRRKKKGKRKGEAHKQSGRRKAETRVVPEFLSSNLESAQPEQSIWKAGKQESAAGFPHRGAAAGRSWPLDAAPPARSGVWPIVVQAGWGCRSQVRSLRRTPGMPGFWQRLHSRMPQPQVPLTGQWREDDLALAIYGADSVGHIGPVRGRNI